MFGVITAGFSSLAGIVTWASGFYIHPGLIVAVAAVTVFTIFKKLGG